MKRLVYILPLLFFAQVAFGQVIPQKITVLNAGGLGGGGISKLGNSPYALIKLNDSTYLVDTTLILTKLEGNYLYYPATGNPSSFLQNIAGLIVPGTGMTRTGSGTSGDPYVFNSTGSGTGGVTKVFAGYGLLNVNDSTLQLDSAAIKQTQYLKSPIYADGDTTKFKSDSVPRLSYYNVFTNQLNANSLVPKSYADSLLALKLNITDSTNKWVNNVVQQDDSTFNVFKGGTVTPIVIHGHGGGGSSGNDTAYVKISSPIAKTLVFFHSNRSIPADTVNFNFAIVPKAPLYLIPKAGADPYDSVAISQAGTSSNGFLSSTDWNKFNSSPVDTFKIITKSGQPTSLPSREAFALLLRDTLPAASQPAPAVMWQGRQNNANFFWRLWGDGGNGRMSLDYSTDTTVYGGWSPKFTIDRTGLFIAPYGNFSGYVSSGQFAGTRGSFNAASGTLVLGANSASNPNASAESRTSSQGSLIVPVLNTANRLKITSSLRAGVITNAGSGGTNGTYTTQPLSGGSGTGAAAQTIIVSGGAVTSVLIPVSTPGVGYKITDILSNTSIPGLTGFQYSITKLSGDTSDLLMMGDTSLHKYYYYDKGQHIQTPFLDSTKIQMGNYVASGNGISTTITVPHGLSFITSSSVISLTAKNAASASFSYVTTDATNIYITYPTAPASGTNNLSYDVFIKP